VIIIKKLNQNLGAHFAIFSTPILYGGFYVATEIAMQEMGIFWVSAVRIIIAFIGILPFLKRLKKVDKKILLVNLGISVAVFVGMITQSFAIRLSSISTTGFIAALFIIFTPLLQRIFFKQKMKLFFLIPILISVGGYYVMFRNPVSNNFEFGMGDWFAVVGSLMIATQIVLTDQYIGDNDAIVFAILQIMIILILSVPIALIFDTPPNLPSLSLVSWICLVFLGIGGTILPYFFQAWGQKYVKSMVAALIIVSEPIFATLFGVIFGNETITPNFLYGGILILLSAFISIVFQNYKKK